MRKVIVQILSLGLFSLALASAQAQTQPLSTNAPGTNPPPSDALSAGGPAGGTNALATNTPAPTDLAPPPIAQPEAQPPKEVPPPKPKPKIPTLPTYQGKLTNLDKIALTISVAVKGKERTFHITPNTRFTKEGKPAILGDGVLDDDVVVVAKPAKKGVQNAVTVRYGPKTESHKAAPHKPKKAAAPASAAKAPGN